MAVKQRASMPKGRGSKSAPEPDGRQFGLQHDDRSCTLLSDERKREDESQREIELLRVSADVRLEAERKRGDLLAAVNEACAGLLSGGALEAELPKALRLIGLRMKLGVFVYGAYLPPDAASDRGYIEWRHEWAGDRRIASALADPKATRANLQHQAEAGSEFAGERRTFVDDTRALPVRFRNYIEGFGARSVFSVPVSVQGDYVGSLSGADADPRHWVLAEIEALNLLAASIGAAITREREVQARLAAERELAGERARMARDIHDTLAQGFTGVVIQLGVGAEALKDGDVAAGAAHMERAAAHARLGLAEARRSVHALRPPFGADEDFVAALRRSATRMFDGLPLEISCDVEGIPWPLPLGVDLEVYRITQEALGNAMRHARASRVDLKLVFEPHRLMLLVRDDGIGFDPDAAATNGGFGMISMRERAARIGATLTIYSGHGRGSWVGIALLRHSKLEPIEANP